MDTQIQLGSFIFQDLEIPEYINFGGTQQLVQHDLIGGNRVIDAMGKSDVDIQWSGLMTGPTALQRAQQLNQLRVAGQQLTLQWFNLNYNVVIQNFVSRTERFYQVSYDITLRVIADGANPVTTLNLVGFNEAVNSDLTTANNLTSNIAATNTNAGINTQPVTAAVTALTTAVAAVPTLNGASPGIIAAIESYANTALTAVTTALKSAEDFLFGSSS